MKPASPIAYSYATTSASIEAAMAYLTKLRKPLVGPPLPVIGRNVIIWRPADKVEADLPPLTISRI